MSENRLKRVLALLLSVFILLAVSSCGKQGTDGEEKTTNAAAAIASDDTMETEEAVTEEQTTSAAPEVDLTAYPVNLLGQSVKTYRKKYADVYSDMYFSNYMCLEIEELFPDVFYLTSSYDLVETDSVLRDDAVFETLFTSVDTELYPSLRIGSTYQDYANSFALSACEYREDYCYYTATFQIPIDGEQATVYLFFYEPDSVCNSILITVSRELRFSTLNIKESDRDQFPVLYAGRSALKMQQKYADFKTDITDYDTDLRKHVYLGVSTDQEPKPISEKAIVKGVNISTDEWQAVPGIRIGDSAAGAGYTAYLEEEADSYYYDTYFLGGLFLETYVTVDENENFSWFTFLCKQLYDD